MTKKIRKTTAVHLILFLCFISIGSIMHAQTATVSYPFAVGRTSCGSGTQQIHFYNYNETTNTITNASGGLVGTCIPQLRIGTTNTSGQRFTSSVASVSFNPKDHNIYYFWTSYGPSSLTQGAAARTFAWKWQLGTCPTATSPRMDTLRSFASDILGVAFDNNGKGYIIEFTNALPTTPPTYKAMIRSIDFSTGILGAADTLALTGGAKIYAQGSGDVVMTPSGQMFFIVDNKLFTPNYQSYTGTGTNLTCTYIDTVRLSGNFVGLTYAEGETIAAYSGGTCPFYEVNPLTAGTTNVTKSGTVYSAADMATVVSGIGAAKKLVSVTPTGTPNQYNVVYDVYVQNYGNMDITNVHVTDDLTAINGAANVSNVTTAFVGSAPSGISLNALFNGNSNKNLLNGTGTLPNYPVSSNNFTIRISCRLSNIQSGIIYKNSAIATATDFNSNALRDSSTNGSLPDLNSNDKPDDAGEGQPTPLLIAVTPQTPPCSVLGQVFYSENFGTGAISATLPASPGGTTQYSGVTTQPLAIDGFMLATNANMGDNSKFISLTDHTNGTGRMMIVNADANAKIFYSGTVGSLCAGQQYSLSFYAAFIGNSSYQTICNGFGGFKYPNVRMRVKDATTGLIITEIATGDITFASWNQYGMKWVMPSGYSSIIFELINEGQGGCGNDLALDDIQFGTCNAAPVVSVSGTMNGCLGVGTTLNATLSDPGVIPGTIQYQWQISSDNATWSDIASATGSSYTIASVTATDVNKYYRVLVAAQGNIGSVSCRYASPGFFLTAKSSSTAPSGISKDRMIICPGDPIVLRANGGTFGTNANYQWYSESCGGTYLGSGSTITVTPLVATTYYVRIEGDCNATSCVSIAITFNCDIDADDDGIPDVTESNAVDPKLDDDFDGIPNWRDANYAGFTDTNSDGVNDNFDKDRDGVPNFLDRDSDNDGIPDVVEAGGGDSDGNGIIDGYTDTDGDGFSQNVDANNTGALGSGSGLGIPDLDSDGVPNHVDLDSDNDGIPDVVEVYGTDSNNDGKLDYSGSFASNDTDGDGFLNAADGDADGNTSIENVSGPLLKTGSVLPNGSASWYPNKNMDSDSKASPYDLDSDGDGIADVLEASFTDANFDGRIDGSINTNGWSSVVSALGSLVLPNRDGTGRANIYDVDSDDDGIPDNIEGQCTICYLLPSGADSDSDGIDDSYDNYVGFGGQGIAINNMDGDAYPDYLDLDTDGDGLVDIYEGNDFNLNGIPDDNITLTGVDADGDGLDNRFDSDNGNGHGTSAHMGNGGSLVGPGSPGSNTMVQKSWPSNFDRDWRYVDYVLPLRFVSFKAELINAEVVLNWSTANNQNINYFSVQRSFDGKNFEEINILYRSSSTEIDNYFYKDNIRSNAAPQLFYKIKALSTDQSIKYSCTVSVDKESTIKLQVAPNPVYKTMQVIVNSSEKAEASMFIMDISGRIIYKSGEKLNKGINKITVPVNKEWLSGSYFVKLLLNGKINSTKFSIQQ